MYIETSNKLTITTDRNFMATDKNNNKTFYSNKSQ